MGTIPVKDYNWLEEHINSATKEVESWPSWKSKGSTIDENDDTTIEIQHDKKAGILS